MGVENLLMRREFPVDGLTSHFFFAPSPEARSANVAVWIRLRHPLRLFASTARVESWLPNNSIRRSTVNTAAILRFQESIAGHPYLIEVSAVTADRWRACIVRIPGVPTALMPFYGPTPDEAAASLRQWLTRAHARASGSGS